MPVEPLLGQLPATLSPTEAPMFPLLLLIGRLGHAAPQQGPTASIAGGALFMDRDEEVATAWEVIPRVGFTLGLVWTFEASMGIHQGQIPELQLPWLGLTPRADLQINMAPDHWLQPFFLGGGGLLWKQARPGAAGVLLPESARSSRFVRENPHSDFMLNFGTGAMFRLSGPWFFRTDVRSLIHFGEDQVGDYPEEYGNWEVSGGICFRGVELNRDQDGDGVPDRFDECPQRREDRDGNQDEDGCPDDDDDKDGVSDKQDQCPEEEEDRDGFEDKDGCPDPDNDKDGVADWNDACPDQKEDTDGFDDKDGCPDKDNDKDGVKDDADSCPDLAEDRDGFEDTDGCPDKDNDGDGIADDHDGCPGEPENTNGVDDDDGCPDEKVAPPADTFNGVIPGVNFEPNSDRLTVSSYPVLDQVAATLARYPTIRIEVQGHTDSDGPDKNNLDLSARRARTVVQALIQRGVDPGRLEYVGYGETQPLVPNNSREHKAINRRVEFRRLDKAGG